MKSIIIGVILLFSLQSISCRAYQEIDNSRIYSERELDSRPAYPGGTNAMKEFVKKHLKWPEDYGNSGYVILSAVIGKDGSIIDAKVKRTLCVFCDQSALDVLKKMPKWIPGSIKNKSVNVRIQIPIRFEIITK